MRCLMMENSRVLPVVGDGMIYEQGHFFHGICRIPMAEVGKKKVTDRDWSTTDTFSNGWYWSRESLQRPTACSIDIA